MTEFLHRVDFYTATYLQEDTTEALGYLVGFVTRVCRKQYMRRLSYETAITVPAMVLCLMTATATMATDAACSETETTFERRDKGYRYTIRLPSPLPPDTLIAELFELGTVRKLGGYADTVFARQVDSLTYEVVSRFSALTVNGSTSYLRTLHPTHDSISITMLRFEHNFPLLPRPRQIHAWFVATPRHEGSCLEYVQEVEMPDRIGPIYTMIVKRELRKFAEKLEKLVGMETRPPPGSAARSTGSSR